MMMERYFYGMAHRDSGSDKDFFFHWFYLESNLGLVICVHY